MKLEKYKYVGLHDDFSDFLESKYTCTKDLYQTSRQHKSIVLRLWRPEKVLCGIPAQAPFRTWFDNKSRVANKHVCRKWCPLSHPLSGGWAKRPLCQLAREITLPGATFFPGTFFLTPWCHAVEIGHKTNNKNIFSEGKRNDKDEMYDLTFQLSLSTRHEKIE